ncbi:hypothetical protein C8R45DRAFT_942329 [Mycena sanguinolenta]|nr:hypothetical protein C8R45DRAFT_942329 [Mycena sanguinolenta]
MPEFLFDVMSQRQRQEVAPKVTLSSADYWTGAAVEAVPTVCGVRMLITVGDFRQIPPHELVLKVGAICRFTRNFDASRGLTKNTRVIVRNLLRHTVEVETISSMVAGRVVEPVRLHLPRIDCHFQPVGFKFVVHRKQIPLALCYATTFNGCQGLTAFCFHGTAPLHFIPLPGPQQPLSMALDRSWRGAVNWLQYIAQTQGFRVAHADSRVPNVGAATDCRNYRCAILSYDRHWVLNAFRNVRHAAHLPLRAHPRPDGRGDQPLRHPPHAVERHPRDHGRRPLVRRNNRSRALPPLLPRLHHVPARHSPLLKRDFPRLGDPQRASTRLSPATLQANQTRIHLVVGAIVAQMFTYPLEVIRRHTQQASEKGNRSERVAREWLAWFFHWARDWAIQAGSDLCYLPKGYPPANAETQPHREGGEASMASNETERRCDLCNKTVSFGLGGEANWVEHVGGKVHQQNKRAAEGTKDIKSYFNSKPKVPVARTSAHTTAAGSHIPTPPHLAPSSLILVIDDDDDVADATPIADADALTSDPRNVLLARFRLVISTLPPTIPLASDSDPITSFAINPATLVGPGQDPWEDVIHRAIDSLMYDGGRSKNSLELSHSIRRGENGMSGLANWMEKCFFDLHISLGMLEPRIERLIQAMLFLGATSSVELQPSPTSQPAPKRMSAPPKPSVGCIGQVLPVKDGHSPFLAYPLALHAQRERLWSVEFGPKLVIRSFACKRHLETSAICPPCKKLVHNRIIKKLLERNEDGLKPGTTFAYLTVDNMQTLLRKKNEQINSLKLFGLTLSQTLLVRATHLEGYSRLRIAVARNDVPRIHTIIANDLKNGASLFASLDKVSRATEGNFNPKSYARAEHQLSYLLWQLGGRAAAELGQRCLGLPSIPSVKRHIATTPLVVSPKAPAKDEMQHNLSISYPTPNPSPPDRSIGPGFQIMVDELKVEGRMRWDARSNMILGICREHSANYELEFKSIEEAEALHAALGSKDVHLASEATVVAVNSFSDVPSRNISHPFIIAPTCKAEAAEGQKRLLCDARDAVNKQANRIGGRLYCISSDGDSKRRAATLLFTFHRELDRNSELFKKLGYLALFDYHCGDGELTGNIDPEHICKRLRNTLIRQLASTLDGVVLTRQLIKQHLVRDSRHNTHHLDGLLNPNDRQNVKLMYDLLSSIAVLPAAQETDTPPFQNTRRVLRLLGAFYRHILEAYTNIKLSLHEQLTHISAAMHLMMALYQKEAGRFVPSQTYFDFMTTGKNLFFCVAKTQIDDPSGKFWIISPGTDPLELLFGRVRTMIGSDSNADMSQLGSRLNAAMECDNILAEHPEWSRGSHRLRMPVWQDAAGDTTWFMGRQASERDLLEAQWEPPFKSMEEKGGFSIFCPFGKNEMVLLGTRRDDEREEDDDDRDVPTQTSPSLTAEPLLPDSDAPFMPDLDDVAEEAVANLTPAPKAHEQYLSVSNSTIKQHKSTILRIYSGRFSVAESRDRLKRVRGFSRHNEGANGSLNSNDAIPGEPMVMVEDPAAVLVRSNGFIWLAVVIISGIAFGTKQVETLPRRLLGEPNVRVKVQIMDLEPAEIPPDASSELGDWEWTGKFVSVSESGISKIFETEGSTIQLLNPAVFASRNLAKRGSATYHFKSVELVAITASMEIALRNTKKLPKIALSSSFPYRTRGGFACFVCNREGSSLEQNEGLCSLCPTASLSVTSPAKLVEHMAIHMLFDQNPPVERDASPCGFCLSTNSFCTIVVIKNKGSDGAVRIDMDRSRCPNLGNLGLATGAKSSGKKPCTNRPLLCPVSPCPDVIWKYNLKSHIQSVHPGANVNNYKSFYELADGEEANLKRISTTKKRKSKTKKINIRISPQHGTEAALGDFSQLPHASGDEHDSDDNESQASSRSSSPEHVPESLPTVRALSPDEEMPVPSALHDAPESSSIQNDPDEEPPGVSRPGSPVPSDSIPTIPGEMDTVSQPESIADEPAPQATSTVRRSTRAVKRRIVQSDTEEDDGCSSPDCTITGSEPMAHLCCVGLTHEPAEWYCDDNCKENAGGRVRKKKKV